MSDEERAREAAFNAMFGLVELCEQRLAHIRDQCIKASQHGRPLIPTEVAELAQFVDAHFVILQKTRRETIEALETLRLLRPPADVVH